MEQIEIKNIITSLISNIDSLGFGSTLLESYTSEELRKLVVQLGDNQQDYPEKTFRKLLNIILETRCRLMNHNFTWSDENKMRFLEVNENLNQTIQEVHKEASKIFSDIDNRIKGNDAFLKDFEIDISVAPYIKNTKIPPTIINTNMRILSGIHAVLSALIAIYSKIMPCIKLPIRVISEPAPITCKIVFLGLSKTQSKSPRVIMRLKVSNPRTILYVSTKRL